MNLIANARPARLEGRYQRAMDSGIRCYGSLPNGSTLPARHWPIPAGPCTPASSKASTTGSKERQLQIATPGTVPEVLAELIESCREGGYHREPMKYFEPKTVDEAIAALAGADDARCLAGGATLVAMLNAQLVDPQVLVGLRKIHSLRGISLTAKGIRIGAMTTHNEIAADDRLVGATAVVRSAAGQIAHDAIRDVGTIGGSIAHADPSADFPAAITAADASIEIATSSGARSVSVDDFFLDYLQTAVQPGEIVTAIDIPSGPKNARGHYLKYARVDGDYATVSIAIVLAMDGKRCDYVRFVAGACGPRPIRVVAAEDRLLGTELTAEDIAAAGDLLAAEADPIGDVRGSSEYRRLLIPRLLRRAITVIKQTPHD